MTPDQTAPKGAHIVCNIGHQTLSEEKADNNCHDQRGNGLMLSGKVLMQALPQHVNSKMKATSKSN